LISILFIGTPLNKPYSGQGEWTVVNHKKGTLDYKDSNWIGMDSVIIADMFFKKPTVVSSANIGYLESTGAWIFPPEKVQILRSYDGASFSNPIHVKLETPLNNDNLGLKNIFLKVQDEVLALRIVTKNQNIPEWHLAKDNAA
jgi:hexosaminidase